MENRKRKCSDIVPVIEVDDDNGDDFGSDLRLYSEFRRREMVVVNKDMEFDSDSQRRTEIGKVGLIETNVDCDYDEFIYEGLELFGDDFVVGKSKSVGKGVFNVGNVENFVNLDDDKPVKFVDLLEEDSDNDCVIIVNKANVGIETHECNDKAIVEVSKSALKDEARQVNDCNEFDSLIYMLIEGISALQLDHNVDRYFADAVVDVDNDRYNSSISLRNSENSAGDDPRLVITGFHGDDNIFKNSSEATFAARDAENVDRFADDVPDGNKVISLEDDGEEDVDPQFKIFLEKACAYGRAYVLEVLLSNEASVNVKYETEDDSVDMCNEDDVVEVRNCPTRNHEITQNVLSGEVRMSIESKRARLENHKDVTDITCMGSKFLMTGMAYNGQTNRSTVADGFNLNRCERNENKEDGIYKLFLDSLKNDGKHMMLTLAEVHMELIYDEDEDEDEGEDEHSSSDSEMVVMDKDPFFVEGYTPFVTSKSYLLDECVCCQTGSRNGHSHFSERLLEILKRPYDEKEYRDLLYIAEQRKPVECIRNLRTATITYPTEENGLSYLDQHIELAKKIEEAKAEDNRPKILNLLRGFFFWLQNLVHEGVFKPWMDSCLELQPLHIQENSSLIHFMASEDQNVVSNT